MLDFVTKPQTLNPARGAPIWTALITEDFEPHSAFVRGHLDIDELEIDADEAIAEAFGNLLPDGATELREILDEAGGARLDHHWMRVTDRDGDIAFFEFCSPSADDAFPVTAARFA